MFPVLFYFSIVSFDSITNAGPVLGLHIALATNCPQNHNNRNLVWKPFYSSIGISQTWVTHPNTRVAQIREEIRPSLSVMARSSARWCQYSKTVAYCKAECENRLWCTGFQVSNRQNGLSCDLSDEELLGDAYSTGKAYRDPTVDVDWYERQFWRKSVGKRIVEDGRTSAQHSKLQGCWQQCVRSDWCRTFYFERQGKNMACQFLEADRQLTPYPFQVAPYQGAMLERIHFIRYKNAATTWVETSQVTDKTRDIGNTHAGNCIIKCNDSVRQCTATMYVKETQECRYSITTVGVTSADVWRGEETDNEIYVRIIQKYNRSEDL